MSLERVLLSSALVVGGGYALRHQQMMTPRSIQNSCVKKPVCDGQDNLQVLCDDSEGTYKFVKEVGKY